jgi:hypothetical protein
MSLVPRPKPLELAEEHHIDVEATLCSLENHREKVCHCPMAVAKRSPKHTQIHLFFNIQKKIFIEPKTLLDKTNIQYLCSPLRLKHVTYRVW